MTTHTHLFQRVIDTHDLRTIAAAFGLHVGTIKRWVTTENIPKQYEGDFMRLLGKDGDPRIESNTVRAKDQFYTKPKIAAQCYQQFLKIADKLGVNLTGYQFIEPSAGCGWFADLLPKNCIAIDIDPAKDRSDIIKTDYLRWGPPKRGKFVVIGNPPFGLRGHLALQFINHSAQFADMVAFILPQLFESDGKGAPFKRVDSRYHLAHSETLPKDSFIQADGTPINISTIFQVWTAINIDRIPRRRPKTCKQFVRVFSLSDGGTPASTRNKKMIDRCDVYLPSTCFNGMKAYDSFEELPNRRGYGVFIHKNKRAIKRLLKDCDWQNIAFSSTNGALNLRTSIIENVIIKGGFYD